MGRPEQRERSKKRAAKSCQKMDDFLTKKKKVSDESEERATTFEQRRNEPEKCSEESKSKDRATCSNTSTDQMIDDIGKLINDTISVDDVNTVFNNMGSAQKYHLLKYHFQPNSTYVFPATFIGGCHRSFKLQWLNLYKWMLYSPTLDACFCKYCSIFADKRETRGMFVNRPFTKWYKMNEKASDHSKTDYHMQSVKLAQGFINGIENPESQIDVKLDNVIANNIEKNRTIITAIVESVLFCARQCIGLRGDNETSLSCGNPGNFLALLRLIASYNPVLKKHLEAPEMKNATYISSTIQNEIIDVIGLHIIQNEIVEKIIRAKYFTILADEVTSHNTEQLALCIRYVDPDTADINEDFIQFSKLTRTTGLYISTEIKDTLAKLRIPIECCRGQGYDGASNMSSSSVGVQARVKVDAPLATYLHCAGHCLNLVIAHSCKDVAIRNMIDKIKECCNFFLHSPKREGLLVQSINNAADQVHETSNRKPLIDMCRTRWASRHDSYRHFYQAYTYIVTSLGVIAHSFRADEFPDFSGDWDTKTKQRASSLLAGITSFDFIITFLTVYQYLSHIAGITVKLQGRSTDIIDAYYGMEEIKSTYLAMRKEVHNNFDIVFKQATRMAEKVGVIPENPRRVGIQKNRANAPAETVKEYYLRNLVMPFLDFIISELDSRFTDLSKTAVSLLILTPRTLCEKPNALQLLAVSIAAYSADLPSPEMTEMELLRWKNKFMAVPVDKRPETVAQSLKMCDSILFPNVYELLKIAATLPVTSCECERSASALRRLHTFMRASMTEDRLTALALTHIHYNHVIHTDTVVSKFSTLHPRRMKMGNLFSN